MEGDRGEFLTGRVTSGLVGRFGWEGGLFAVMRERGSARVRIEGGGGMRFGGAGGRAGI